MQVHLKKALSALALATAAVGAQANVVVNEGFDVTNFQPNGVPVGWSFNNQSTAGGTTNWFQGNTSVFSS
jgi:hypothetical protein